MNQADLKRVTTLKRTGRLWRFYNWLYEPTHPERTTFCRLFWGVVAAPLVLIVAFFVWVGEKVGHLWAKRGEKAPKRKPPVTPAAVPRPVKTGPSWRDQLVSVLACVADRVASFFQMVGRPFAAAGRGARRHPWIGTTVRGTFLGLGILIGVAAVGAILSGLVAAFYLYATGTLRVLAVAGIVAAAFAVVVALSYWLAEMRGAIWIGRHLLIPIGHFFRAIARFFYAGYYYTKTRTCPRIELVD